LKVVIITRSQNHAGIDGLAYSDVPLAPKAWKDGTGFSLEVPGPIVDTGADGKIDEHWWAVYAGD
jgi:hypothetical protein